MKYDEFMVLKVTNWGNLRVVELSEDEHRLSGWLNDIMVSGVCIMFVYSTGFYAFHLLKLVISLF